MTFRLFAFSILACAALAGTAMAGAQTSPAPQQQSSGVTIDDLMDMKEAAEREETEGGARIVAPEPAPQKTQQPAPNAQQAAPAGSSPSSRQTTFANNINDDYGNGPPIDVVNLKVTKDDYIDPNMKNLSKLMWHLGVLDLSDSVAVDNYLLINECEMFLRFYNNDIEWEKIRNATRIHLRDKMAKFPNKFEILVPMFMDRYNIEKQYFDLHNNSKMVNVRRLDIHMGNRKELCNERGSEIRGYPRNIILTLNRPFSFTRIPVNRQLAQMYIEESKIAYSNLPLKMQNFNYQRPIFMRAKVSITSMKEVLQGRQGGAQAVLIGQLDGVEIFADVEMQKLLYRENKENKSIRQRRREEREERKAAEEKAREEYAPVGSQE